MNKNSKQRKHKQKPININHLSHMKKLTNYLLYDLLILKISFYSPSSPLEHFLVVIPMHCNTKKYRKIAKEVSKNFHDRRHSTSCQSVDIASPGRLIIYFDYFHLKFWQRLMNSDIFLYSIFSIFQKNN